MNNKNCPYYRDNNFSGLTTHLFCRKTGQVALTQNHETLCCEECVIMKNNHMTLNPTEKTNDSFNRLTAQLAVLKEVEMEYRGLTIGNVIQQMEARLKEYR